MAKFAKQYVYYSVSWSFAKNIISHYVFWTANAFIDHLSPCVIRLRTVQMHSSNELIT